MEKIENPCKDCLTLPVCKNSFGGLVYISILNLSKKCSLINNFTSINKAFWNTDSINEAAKFFGWIDDKHTM